ncbi:MAG: hypothetical protein HZA48_02550 [Planctomycetes bacterium]|nr:hypothetical protein [Planctomycetota bacterium]
MNKTLNSKYAIVRGVAGTYDKCVKPGARKQEIDVELAIEQHNAYCAILENMGLELMKIPADGRFPDCCFAEDPGIIFGQKAVISRMKTASRAGETTSIKKALSIHKKIFEIRAPGTIDGGDVLKAGNRVYIGLSKRTNLSAIRQVESFISKDGYEIIPVKIRNTLHLKTVCTHIGNNCMVIAPGHFDDGIFADYDIIRVPKNESYSANCLAINGKVIIPRGFPKTKALIENKGFKTIQAGMSEFEKGGGSLTCLSIVYN